MEEVWHHQEKIRCPECEESQLATVEHTRPWYSYVHTCSECGYVITESEWERKDQHGKKL